MSSTNKQTSGLYSSLPPIQRDGSAGHARHLARGVECHRDGVERQPNDSNPSHRAIHRDFHMAPRTRRTRGPTLPRPPASPCQHGPRAPEHPPTPPCRFGRSSSSPETPCRPRLATNPPPRRPRRPCPIRSNARLRAVKTEPGADPQGREPAGSWTSARPGSMEHGNPRQATLAEVRIRPSDSIIPPPFP